MRRLCLFNSLKVLLDASLVTLGPALVVETVVDGGVRATGSGLDLSLDLSVVLLRGPSSAVLVPDPDGPSDNVGEARNADEEGELDTGRVGDGTLDGSDDGTTGNTHDKETGGSSSVSSETARAEHEDDGVHDRLETHDGDHANNTASAVQGTDEDDHEEGTGGAEGEEDGSSDNGEQGGTDESADGEGDETVREELGTSLVGKTGDVVCVEEEEGTDGDLSTDVEELGDETGDGSDLLVEGLVELVVGAALGVGKGLGLGLKSLLRDFGELGEEEGKSDHDTETGDGHVDELDRGKIVGVFTREEELGGDEGTREGRYTVPA